MSMRKGSAAAVLVLVVLLFLSACTGTKFVNTQRDASYTGRMNKVFVLGVVRSRGARTLLEDELVRLLAARGLTAMASTSLMPDETVPERAAVAAKVRETGADSVLVTRFIRKSTEDTHKPARIYASPQNLDAEWETVVGSAALVDPGIAEGSFDHWVVVMRTTVYSVAAGTAVWSSLSETTYQGALVHQIKPFARAVVKKLAKEKLVP
jgi:hypothetical protein